MTLAVMAGLDKGIPGRGHTAVPGAGWNILCEDKYTVADTVRTWF